MNVTVAPRFARGGGELIKKVLWAFVDDGMNCIKTQAVEIVFGYPVDRVVDDEITDGLGVFGIVIDRCTPRGVVGFGEDVGI